MCVGLEFLRLVLFLQLVYLSFIFAGLLWWTRLEGVVILFVITVIFFVVNKKSPKLILKYLLCLMIFALVVSPLLMQRYDQFDDPFYLYYNDHLFVEEYVGVGVKESEKTASNYIEEQGIFKFVERFLLTGSSNVIEQTIRLSFPYLLILLPFGLLFSLRPFDQNSSYIKANWIVILVHGKLSLPYKKFYIEIKDVEEIKKNLSSTQKFKLSNNFPICCIVLT